MLELLERFGAIPVVGGFLLGLAALITALSGYRGVSGKIAVDQQGAARANFDSLAGKALEMVERMQSRMQTLETKLDALRELYEECERSKKDLAHRVSVLEGRGGP